MERLGFTRHLAGSCAVVSHFATERCPPSHAPRGPSTDDVGGHARHAQTGLAGARAAALGGCASRFPRGHSTTLGSAGDSSISLVFVEAARGFLTRSLAPPCSSRSARRARRHPLRAIAPRARASPSPPRAALSVHTVQSGEESAAEPSPARASRAAGELVAVNASALGGSDVIYPGQQLVIPSGGKPPPRTRSSPRPRYSFKSTGAPRDRAPGFDPRASSRGRASASSPRARFSSPSPSASPPSRRTRTSGRGTPAATTASRRPKYDDQAGASGVAASSRATTTSTTEGSGSSTRARGAAGRRTLPPTEGSSTRDREPQHLVNDEGVKNEESSRNASHEKGVDRGRDATSRAERARVGEQTNSRRRRSRQQTRQ